MRDSSLLPTDLRNYFLGKSNPVPKKNIVDHFNQFYINNIEQEINFWLIENLSIGTLVYTRNRKYKKTDLFELIEINAKCEEEHEDN